MMGNDSRIREHMPVVDRDNEEIAMVDHLDAQETIKLAKDNQGQHHWIPMTWVTGVDDKVHVGRSVRQAQQEWMSSAPGRE